VNYNDEKDPLEGIREKLPERYRSSKTPVGLWWRFYYKISGDFYLLPGMRRLDIKDLSRIMGERLTMPYQLKALRLSEADSRAFRECLTAHDKGGEEAFLGAWNKNKLRLPDQPKGERLTMFRDNDTRQLNLQDLKLKGVITE